MTTMALPRPRQPAPRLSALLVSAEGAHRRNWTGHLRRVGIGQVLEALGPEDAISRGRVAAEHGVCVVEAAPQDGSILHAIRELRRQGWYRLVLVCPRGDAHTVRLAMAAKVRSFVVAGDTRTTRSPGIRPGPLRDNLDLSAREVQVIQLVADGHSNRTIGERLNLSALTVKSHLSRIGRKLGTGDRAEIVAITMRSGVIH